MKIFIYIVLLSFIFVGCGSSGGNNTSLNESINSDTPISESDLILQNAYEKGLSNVQVEGKGKVLTILADDTSGSKHQKFILLLATDQTLLISHNIDLAPRIKNLREDDFVTFYGEYEWNNKGGVIHWTHKDPNGSHKDGWLKHNGVIYQ